VVCNEYCGIGHDYMYFSIIVEETQKEEHHEMSKEQHEEMPREQQEKSSPKPKDHKHGEHGHGK
jgi:heme/copper-type cytochrome/quinol oxidase subunit 2